MNCWDVDIEALRIGRAILVVAAPDATRARLVAIACTHHPHGAVVHSVAPVRDGVRATPMNPVCRGLANEQGVPRDELELAEAIAGENDKSIKELIAASSIGPAALEEELAELRAYERYLKPGRSSRKPMLCSNCQSTRHARCCARCGSTHDADRLTREFCSDDCEQAQRYEDALSSSIENHTRKSLNK